jgi:hypothetical protein
VSVRAADEARALIRLKVEEIRALTWEELDTYGERVEEVVSSSGRRLRLKSSTFWDTEEWASGIYIVAKAYPVTGWRRWWPYREVTTRGGPDDLVPPRPPEARRFGERPASG